MMEGLETNISQFEAGPQFKLATMREGHNYNWRNKESPLLEPEGLLQKIRVLQDDYSPAGFTCPTADVGRYVVDSSCCCGCSEEVAAEWYNRVLRKEELPLHWTLLLTFLETQNAAGEYWGKVMLQDKQTKEIQLRSVVKNPNPGRKKHPSRDEEWFIHSSEFAAHGNFFKNIPAQLAAQQ